MLSRSEATAAMLLLPMVRSSIVSILLNCSDIFLISLIVFIVIINLKISFFILHYSPVKIRGILG